MSNLYYTSTFYSKLTNTGYKIEIKAKTLTAGNETEFKLRADGFKVKWNKGKDEKLSQIKTSKLTFGFIIENETDPRRNKRNTKLHRGGILYCCNFNKFRHCILYRLDKTSIQQKK